MIRQARTGRKTYHGNLSESTQNQCLDELTADASSANHEDIGFRCLHSTAPIRGLSLARRRCGYTYVVKAPSLAILMRMRRLATRPWCRSTPCRGPSSNTIASHSSVHAGVTHTHTLLNYVSDVPNRSQWARSMQLGLIAAVPSIAFTSA